MGEHSPESHACHPPADSWEIHPPGVIAALVITIALIVGWVWL